MVVDLVKKKGFKINNVDTVVNAQEPVLSPFKKRIQETIAQVLRVKPDCVNIKAKTNEGLGEIGAKMAIAAYAVTVVVKGRQK
jgi:2-C-methyl-D-erythritol 2,4-cyclodiphosphate synthase